MYLLDTNCVSEMPNPQRGTTFATWLAEHILEETFISAITVGELQLGVTKMAPSARQRGLGQWLETILLQWDRRVLPVDRAVMLEWGSMVGSLELAGYTPPRFDSLIAATARVHNLTVVTRNERDFQRCGVKLENPWRD